MISLAPSIQYGIRSGEQLTTNFAIYMLRKNMDQFYVLICKSGNWRTNLIQHNEVEFVSSNSDTVTYLLVVFQSIRSRETFTLCNKTCPSLQILQVTIRSLQNQLLCTASTCPDHQETLRLHYPLRKVTSIMLVHMSFVGGCRFSWSLHSIVCVLCMHVALYLITWSEGYWILHNTLSDSTNPFIILEALPWSKQLWQALYKKMKACRIYQATFKTSISTQLCHCCMENAGGGFWYCFACCCNFWSKIIETVVLTGIEPGKGGWDVVCVWTSRIVEWEPSDWDSGWRKKIVCEVAGSSRFICQFRRCLGQEEPWADGSRFYN